MSNIDKLEIHNQQLKAFITGFLSDPAHDNQSSRSLTAEVFRIALASLEAESVAWLWSHRKHLSEVSLVRPEDDERAEGAHWSGWSCQALYAAPPATVTVPDYPETLPCPVVLEPGLRFGKGVPTKTMLGALLRRTEYHAELEAMTPEQRAEHDAGMKEFAAMLQGAEHVSNRDELPDGWVACSERMPEAGDDMIVFTDDIVMSGISYSKKKGFYIQALEYDDDEPVDNVTHWMSLPAAPQQEA